MDTTIKPLWSLAPLALGALLLLAGIGRRERLRAIARGEIPILLLIPLALCCFEVWPFTLIQAALEACCGAAPWVCVLCFAAVALCASLSALLTGRRGLLFGAVGAALLLIASAMALAGGASPAAALSALYPACALLLCALGCALQPTASAEATPAQDPSAPMLRCLSGAFAGAEFPLKAGEVVALGSDPARCQIVLTGEGIEDEHCRLWCAVGTLDWYAEVLPGGEVRLDGGRLLPPGAPRLLPRGSVLRIGQGREVNQFRLG